MRRIAIGLFVVGLASMLWLTLISEQSSAVGQKLSQRPIDGRQYMRTKLDSTQKVVEGLSTDDFELIKQGAAELLKLSNSAEWRVRRGPKYMHYSADFQAQIQRLIKTAENRNIEGATFSYVHATISCMACHQHVRGVVDIADDAPLRPTSDRRRSL